ncbi:CHAD domain-containing protein [Borborobacter arsenicus]|nr:CHAD domain-containing protein [Pseudaminobacter arsenicus]
MSQPAQTPVASLREADAAPADRPAVAKAPGQARFDTDATLDTVLDFILRSALRRLRESQPAARDSNDPEGIHQYRIGLRRLRSVLGMMRPIVPSWQLESLRGEAKWLMSALNEARAWDVFATETMPPAMRDHPSVEGFDALLEAAESHRKAARDKARAAISSPRTAHFHIALGLWVEQGAWRDEATPESHGMLAGPARDFAAEILGRLHRKTLKRGRHFKRLTPQERHRLRLAFKKFRYTADFFLPLYGKRRKARLLAKTLAKAQDEFGHFNDLAVSEDLVRQIIGGAIPVEAQRAAGALLGWRLRQLELADKHLRSAWKRFRTVRLP